MDTVLVILVISSAAIAAVIISYMVIRWRFEQNFKRWQAEQLILWQQERDSSRKQAIAQSRAVLGGKFTEQMAPYLPEFKYDPTEARFIGSPIDMVVFPGLASGDPKEVVIMEIKSSQNCRLTPQEAKIRQLIEEGMVRWELIQRNGPEEKS